MKLFFYIVHDFLSHLVDEQHKLPAYGSTLGMEIERLVGIDDVRTRADLQRVRLAPADLHVLMHRHFLVHRVLDRDIVTTPDAPSIYLLMGSLYYTDVRFSQISNHKAWGFISDAKSRINGLRSRQKILQSLAQDLANREDVLPHRLDVDHGVLSTFTLLCLLYILETILDYEIALRPTASVVLTRLCVRRTLDDLKGVIFHDES